MRGEGSPQLLRASAFLQEEVALLGCRPMGLQLWGGSSRLSSAQLGSWGGSAGPLGWPHPPLVTTFLGA